MAGWDDFKTKPDIPYKSKSEQQISEIFIDVVTEDREEPYTPQIRASQLPVCILLHAQNLLNPHYRLNEARLAQYSAIGTALHELYQDQYLHSSKWGKYVYGSFTCRNIKCDHVFLRNNVRPDDFAVRKCPKCGQKGVKYAEIEAKFKHVLGIHVDLILKLPKKAILIDFKTSGSFNITNPEFKPKNKHLAQISSYPIVLKREVRLEIDEYSLIYVNRDNPQHSKTSKRQNRTFVFKTNTGFMKLREKHLKKLVLAEKARIAYFKKPSSENLAVLDDLRPCKSLKDYNLDILGMKTAFENESKGCVYANKAGCFKTGFSGAAKDLHKKLKEVKNA